MAEKEPIEDRLMRARADVLFEDLRALAKRDHANILLCFFERENTLQMLYRATSQLSPDEKRFLADALREVASKFEKS
jgi:hypothetical protein